MGKHYHSKVLIHGVIRLSISLVYICLVNGNDKPCHLSVEYEMVTAKSKSRSYASVRGTQIMNEIYRIFLPWTNGGLTMKAYSFNLIQSRLLHHDVRVTEAR